MRRLILILVSIFFIFVIGCQDNSVTEPQIGEKLGKAVSQPDVAFETLEADAGKLLRGKFPLLCTLKDPNPNSRTEYCLDGVVVFEHYLYSTDSENPDGQTYAILKLTYNAKLIQTDPQYREWSIVKIAKERFDFVSDGVHEFTSSMPVQDTNLNLDCSYCVTADGLNLSCISLSNLDR